MSKNARDDDAVPTYSMAELGASLPGVPGLSAASRAGLVNVLKDKLQSLSGVSSGYIESLQPNVKRRVVALQDIQRQHDDFEAKFFEERAALEAKYQQVYEPLYKKRYDIVNGIGDPEAPTDEPPESNAGGKEDTEEKGIPEFWMTALKTNDIVSEEITKRDEGALKYLKDIKSFNLEGTKGFKLEFFFEENPFFKNAVLTKTYHMVEDSEPILESAKGTQIDWYPGKNLTQKVLQKKSRKGGKNANSVTKTEDCESFFNFFDPPKVPEDDEDLDEDAAEQLQDLMEQDYDIGSTIKDKIIPHAVSWFTGEALQGDEFEDGDGEVSEDEEDEEAEEDEDEEEDNADDSDEAPAKKPVSKPKPSRKLTSQQGGEQPPECKQQ